MTVVFLGDSLTQGYGIDLSKRWTDLLIEDVDGKLINSGISGDTTTGMLGRFRTDVVDYQPTHVVITGGTNDLSHGIPYPHILSNVRAMTRHAKFHGIRSVIGLPTRAYAQEEAYDAWSERLFREFIDLVDDYRSRLREWSVSDDQPVIDFAEGMTQQHFLPDGVHPNTKGHVVMAQNALAVLSNMVD